MIGMCVHVSNTIAIILQRKFEYSTLLIYGVVKDPFQCCHIYGVLKSLSDAV
jgi:hypothetical protein